ncbi:DUF1731 domain-containing protein [Aeromicrobium sp. UC242_57]|uniref:DUF1731 domain-containing protein n=1 Tax=Aeromicrobium sp. UC242_57 TaxID=3374624 RepID=UPI0037883BDB
MPSTSPCPRPSRTPSSPGSLARLFAVRRSWPFRASRSGRPSAGIADDLLGSLRVSPGALSEAGFTFSEPDLRAALATARP